MNTKKLYKEILLWTFFVLILSYLCYLPTFLVKKGIDISHVILNVKYLFIAIPFLVSTLFLLKQKDLKKWFHALFFEKINFQAIICCIVIGSIGLCFSIIYCMIAEEYHLFTDNYPTVFAVIFQCCYLFATALLEEIAWRGFLLNKLVAAKGKKIAFVYVGIVWAIWHIPMWAVRNSLGFQEIILYFIWTIFISFILGMLFYKYKNILIVSLSHTVFNTCYLTPVNYNVILLGCMLLLFFLYSAAQQHKFQD